MSAALSSAAGRGLVPQPPLYGRVTDADAQAGTSDVLWDNGLQVATIPDGSLQTLTQPLDATRDAYSNRVARPLVAGLNVASAEYDSKIVGVNAMAIGIGSTEERAVLQSLAGGMWFDEAVANVTVLDNR